MESTLVEAPTPNTDPATWPFRLRPLDGPFGAEILELDLAQPMDAALFGAVYGAFLAHQLLVFRNQALPPAAQVAFSRHFGEVQVHVLNQYHAQGHPEVFFLTNLDASGKPSGAHPDEGTLAWHSDGSWRERTGLATIMYAEEVPAQGGETHFCDMYAAWEALPDARKRQLERLRAIHNLDFSRTRRHGRDPMTEAQKREVPPVAHPVVRTHPETGRRCLFLGDHAETIEGMDYAAGRALVEAINAQAIDPYRVYAHRWSPGELVVWDNRCLLHRATAYDTARERRVMRRCTINGDRPHA
jgi:taurine dioxygenase